MATGLVDTCFGNGYNIGRYCKTYPGLLRAFVGRRREGDSMSEVKVRKDESLDQALKRFKRQCQRSGVLSEVRKREHYDKPSVRRKKKSEAARKRKFF